MPTPTQETNLGRTPNQISPAELKTLLEETKLGATLTGLVTTAHQLINTPIEQIPRPPSVQIESYTEEGVDYPSSIKITHDDWEVRVLRNASKRRYPEISITPPQNRDVVQPEDMRAHVKEVIIMTIQPYSYEAYKNRTLHPQVREVNLVLRCDPGGSWRNLPTVLKLTLNTNEYMNPLSRTQLPWPPEDTLGQMQFLAQKALNIINSLTRTKEEEGFVEL